MAVLEISQICGFMVDMWTNVISWFSSVIGNYAWAIILLTLLIKLLMLPLDFFNKKSTRKNTKMQAVIQPELVKLQEKYGNDKNLLNQKISEVYKKHNYNVVGSCLFMFVNLALTLVIFFSLFSGLNNMASIKITEQYNTLQQTYSTAYAEKISEGEEVAVNYANGQVKLKYDEIKGQYSWLWIDNVWKADMPTKSIPTFDEYLKIAKEVTYEGEKVASNKLSNEQKEVLEAEYEVVMGPLRDVSRSANGYLILVVLIFGTAFASQYITNRKNKKAASTKQDPDGKGNPTQLSGKIMMFVLPVMLAVFALTYNSVFALYLLASQIITLVSTPVIDVVLDKLEQRQERKKLAVQTVSYSRKNTGDKKDNKQKDNKKQDKQEKQVKTENKKVKKEKQNKEKNEDNKQTETLSQAELNSEQKENSEAKEENLEQKQTNEAKENNEAKEENLEQKENNKQNNNKKKNKKNTKKS